MNEIQKKVKEFVERHGLQMKLEYLGLDLASEAGELVKEIAKMSSYGRKDFNPTGEAELEIGDVLYTLANIANTLNVDMEQALSKVLEKMEKRTKNGGSPGSGNI